MGKDKDKKLRISCEERMAFLQHRWGAKKRRNLGFHFTYEEWVAWWKRNLGEDWFELRGRNSEQHVMARYGDKGPYAPWNVKCITHGQNFREGTIGKNRGNAKLTKAQVTVIYKRLRTGRRGTIAQLAIEFGVSECTIRNINSKATWEHVTDLLD